MPIIFLILMFTGNWKTIVKFFVNLGELIIYSHPILLPIIKYIGIPSIILTILHGLAKNSTDRKTIEVLSAVNDLFGLFSKK